MAHGSVGRPSRCTITAYRLRRHRHAIRRSSMCCARVRISVVRRVGAAAQEYSAAVPLAATISGMAPIVSRCECDVATAPRAHPPLQRAKAPCCPRQWRTNNASASLICVCCNTRARLTDYAATAHFLSFLAAGPPPPILPLPFAPLAPLAALGSGLRSACLTVTGPKKLSSRFWLPLPLHFCSRSMALLTRSSANCFSSTRYLRSPSTSQSVHLMSAWEDSSTTSGSLKSLRASSKGKGSGSGYLVVSIFLSASSMQP
mmetsp:Transcript_22353/g.59952  ORF Transcript_22353/g.59952 Transcript_22353/m.59952 type:complete len:259 (-) Transcript_22353:474-1250(-)